MAETKSGPHKMAKNETLDALARLHKLKDANAIWHAPENKSLVSKRKKPEAIQAGDTVFIPPNATEAKEVAKQAAGLYQARDGAMKLRAGLEDERKRLEHKVAVFDELIKGNAEHTEHVIEELERNLSGMKNWAGNVDAVAKLASMGKHLYDLCKIGHAASKASGDALKKLNEKMMEEVKKDGKDKVLEHGATLLGQMKTSSRTALAAVGIVAESWEKMNSPSFWADAATKLVEGKGWSEAVSGEVGDEIEKRIKWVRQQGDQQAKWLGDSKRKFEEQLSHLRPFLKECDDRIRSSESEAAKLPLP